MSTSDQYQTLKRMDHTHLWHPFTQMQEWMGEDPCIIAGGEGSYLIDVNGNRYLDGVSSLWCNLFGHRRPELDQALKAQTDRIAHSTFLGLSHVPGIELAARLTALVPAGLTRVFYSDSGATAVEVALKLAVQYWQLLGRTQKTRFARLEESYHGDTVGAMSVGYSDLFHHYHRDLLFPTLAVKPPYAYQREQGLSEAEAMDRSVQEARDTVTREKERLAAFIMEPVMQGAAGMWPQPAGYVKAIRDICKDNDVLFIADEVATGFGHTGRMWACEHDGVSPDLMCVGKGITGGYLPLAATFATEEIFSAFLGDYGEFKSFFHGHTYTGNPLGCAVALATPRRLRAGCADGNGAAQDRLAGGPDSEGHPHPRPRAGVAPARVHDRDRAGEGQGSAANATTPACGSPTRWCWRPGGGASSSVRWGTR